MQQQIGKVFVKKKKSHPLLEEDGQLQCRNLCITWYSFAKVKTREFQKFLNSYNMRITVVFWMSVNFKFLMVLRFILSPDPWNNFPSKKFLCLRLTHVFLQGLLFHLIFKSTYQEYDISFVSRYCHAIYFWKLLILLSTKIFFEHVNNDRSKE